MLLSSIASIIFQITYKTQNLVKCQRTLSIKTQSIWKVDRKIYQTKHLLDDVTPTSLTPLTGTSVLTPNCCELAAMLAIKFIASVGVLLTMLLH